MTKALKLKLVYQGSFSKNEVTLFEEAMKANKGIELGPSDGVLLVSRSGKMLKFVRRAQEVGYMNASGQNGRKTTVVFSETYRITGGGKWSPYMLANYAEELGLTLEGIKRFEQHVKALSAVA